jgi:hypothetical protein
MSKTVYVVVCLAFVGPASVAEVFASKKMAEDFVRLRKQGGDTYSYTVVKKPLM